MMRRRPAPSAARSAISRRRVAARASSKLATLVHAINSTKPTAPSNNSSEERMFSVVRSCNPVSRDDHPALVSGYCRPRRSASASICACASPRVAVGLRRASTSTDRLSRFSALALVCIGTHSCVRSGKSNPAGITPTTVTLLPLDVMRLPMMSGFAP